MRIKNTGTHVETIKFGDAEISWNPGEEKNLYFRDLLAAAMTSHSKLKPVPDTDAGIPVVDHDPSDTSILVWILLANASFQLCVRTSTGIMRK